MRQRPFQQIAHILLLAAAYFISGRLGLMLPAFGSNITLLWLPTGIAVAALLRFGFAGWPGISLGAVAVNLAVGSPGPVALGIAVGNTCGPWLAAWVLQRMRFHPAFDRSRDILLLAVAGALGMLVSSSLGVATLTLAGVLPPGAREQAWLTWWAGDALGVIAAAPLVLTFTPVEVRAILRRRLEFLSWLVATCLTTWAAFVLNRGGPGQALAVAFTPLPFVAWAALRFGPVGTSLGLILVSGGAAYGTATQTGPFFRASPVQEVALLWLFMVTSAVLGWLISAVNTARRQSVGVQRLFEQALTDVSLGVLLAGLDRRITYANQGFTRLTGYAEAELIGKSCAILQGPETDPVMVKRLAAALRGEGFFEGEILNYRKDGTSFWNALLISPVRDERGVMNGFLGIQRDITKRKQAEVALLQSEEHLRTIIDLEPECVKLLSPEGHLLEMNPAGLAMIEACSLEEVRGLPVSELVVPEDRAAFAEAHRQAMQGATGRCEFAVVGLRGTRRWLETHAVPYRNAQREIIGVLGITRDVTARREAAAELERGLSTLQVFINTVPAFISFVDADERYRLVNKGYEEYFGRPAGQIIGQRVGDVQPAAAYAEMQPHIRTALTGQTVRYQSHPTGPDGRSYWLDVQYVPRRGEDGRVSGFFVLVFDISESKQAEEALRKSEARYRKLFYDNPHPMWVHDFETFRFLAVNDAAITHYGYSREEFLTMTTRDVRPPEEVPALLTAIRQVADGRDYHGPFRHRKRDGTLIDVEVSAHVIDFDGHRAAIVLVTDVTERKLAEVALRRSEAQFRTLADHLPDVVARFDRDRRHLYINPAAESATGLKPEAFVGKTNEELGMPPENTAVWKATLERVFATGADERLEFSYTGPSGKAVWESQVVAERGAGGEIESALVLSRDITGRRQAEEERAALLHALQESQVRLQTLVSNLPGMAYRCINDPNWTMTYVSEGCEAVTSYRRDELENNRTVAYADLIHPDDRDWLWAKCQASLELRTPCQNEYRIVDRHGGERWVAERASGVYADDGTLLAIDGFIQDITAARRAKIEREQIDRKMQETQKLESLGVLAGGIAHDFNNLLTAVLGNASIAKIELPPDSSVHDCLENITEASLRAADLCKQMLAYSGRGRFVVQKLNLSDLVAQTAQMLQISISKKAALRYRLEKELPPVEVDATQIRQVIMNLVINASEAIGDHDGVISLSTGVTRVDRDYLQSTLMDPDLPEGDYVFLEVADSGCGMSAETRARIFDPFFTTKFTGRGLGLAAVLGIVRGHQGAMKVASEVGRGTTFTLLFPVAAGSAEPPMADPTHSPQWRGEGTVLVVDDEEPMRITVARMMRQMGFDPVLATDGHDAVEIFRVEPTRFAFVLLDLTMPRLDGEQTFNELRRLRPDLRVVLMSGFNAQEALVRFPRNALAGFLQKPFTLDELRAVAQVATG